MRIFGRIYSHISELSNNITRLRNGELDVQVRTTRHDEIGDLARNFNSMHQEIFTDKLTQLANRTALNSLFTQRINPKKPQPFLLLFIDLNNFKPLNDTYGHDNGDKALIEIAQRLRQLLNTDDFIARLGGDEFVAVFPGHYEPEHIQTLIAKIKHHIQAPLNTLEDIDPALTVHVGAAIGFARYPLDADNAHDLLKLADKAMYQDK